MPAKPSLRHGRPLVSIPGPSVIPDRVLNAMHRAMPNIYEGALVDLSNGIFDELGGIPRTKGHSFIAVTNGHGAWEMALTNTMKKGDKVLVLESGRFAIGWADVAEFLGIEVEILNAPPRRGVDPAAVEERLRADKAHEIKAILVVQIDTASSAWSDIAAIRKAIDAAGHPALYMADCVASLGCVPYEMDAWGVDVTVGGSQKGLMVPPGLGFTWASEKAMQAHKTADLRISSWDWTKRIAEGAHYWRFHGTPPISHLYGLREALNMIAEEGLENIWTRHKVFGEAVRAAIGAWSTTDGLELNITDPAACSNSVTTVLTGSIRPARLRKVCEDEAGLTLGIALGDEYEGKAFRIGHMGHLNPPMVLGTLATIEAALTVMGAPMGASGIAAAAARVAEGMNR
jgi:alanine-glyoxylate transaminase/serine-glyoxylate transaminase/serine-pyruvate transaminase